MGVSAEIRWFWRDKCPDGFETWFLEGAITPSVGCRDDEYFHDRGQTELGIKRRGGKPGLEIKGAVAVLPASDDVGPFSGPIQIWCKCHLSLSTYPGSPLFRIKKKRWLRKFDMTGGAPIELAPVKDGVDYSLLPSQGCNVELTRIEVEPSKVWWTFGFEAFGDLQAIEGNLRIALATMMERRPPPVEGGEILSYPAWIDKYCLD